MRQRDGQFQQLPQRYDECISAASSGGYVVGVKLGVSDSDREDRGYQARLKQVLKVLLLSEKKAKADTKVILVGDVKVTQCVYNH
jgi:exonuclease III